MLFVNLTRFVTCLCLSMSIFKPRCCYFSDESEYCQTVLAETWPRGYKTFFMLNSAEHEISCARYIKKYKKNQHCLGSDKPRLVFFLLKNVKMPKIVGILTFVSRKNFNRQLEHENIFITSGPDLVTWSSLSSLILDCTVCQNTSSNIYRRYGDWKAALSLFSRNCVGVLNFIAIWFSKNCHWRDMMNLMVFVPR